MNEGDDWEDEWPDSEPQCEYCDDWGCELCVPDDCGNCGQCQWCIELSVQTAEGEGA